MEFTKDIYGYESETHYFNYIKPSSWCTHINRLYMT